MRKEPILYLARHCKTAWNHKRKIQGTKDLPLSPEGVQQAISNCHALEPLKIEHIVSSPARRARETAQVYASHLNVPLTFLDGFWELDHGDWEGEYYYTLLNSPDSQFKQWIEDPTRVPIPGGSESIEEAQRRVVKALKEVVKDHAGKVVLIITHMHIRAILQCTLKGLGLQHMNSQVDRSILPTRIPAYQIQRISLFIF